MKRKNLKKALQDKQRNYDFYKKDKGMKVNGVTAYKIVTRQCIKNIVQFKLPTKGFIVVER